MRKHEKWAIMSSDSDEEEYPRAPAQKARDENIVGVFEATDDPVLTTAEVAEELPIGKRATLNRLEDLRDRGEIESKDVGVGRVWWRSEPDDPLTDVASEAETADRPGQQAPEPEAAGGSVERPPESRPDQPAEPPRTMPEEDVPGSEQPGWAFIGSLGRNSIFAGLFLLGLLLAESSTPQSLLPVSVSRLFLTSFVFFLIGFPAWAAFKSKQFFEMREHSLLGFFRSLLPFGTEER